MRNDGGVVAAPRANRRGCPSLPTFPRHHFLRLTSFRASASPSGPTPTLARFNYRHQRRQRQTRLPIHTTATPSLKAPHGHLEILFKFRVRHYERFERSSKKRFARAYPSASKEDDPADRTYLDSRPNTKVAEGLAPARERTVCQLTRLAMTIATVPRKLWAMRR